MIMQTKIEPNQIWLKEQFSIPGNTIARIARRAGVNEKTIRRKIAKYGIRSRPKAETMWLNQAVHREISDSAVEILDGSLLGDGNLYSARGWSAIYQQTSSQFAFLRFVKVALIQNGIRCRKIAKTQTGFIFGSYSHTALLEHRNRWYKNGIKIVPPGLILTPKMCLFMYLGDGCFCPSNNGFRPYVRIALDNFTINEIDDLNYQLRDFKPWINKYSHGQEGRGYRISLDTSFLEWIGGCPEELIPVYGHKFGLHQRMKWSGKPS